MINVSSDPELLEALRRAAGRRLTADEIREQKISFVMSAISDGCAMTRAEVRQQINRQEGHDD